MQDRREKKRMLFKFEGFSVFDGALIKVKTRDTSSIGVGAYSRHKLKPDQEGILFAKLPGFDEIEQILIAVCWCLPEPKSADASYPYRVGMKILGT